MQRMLRRADDPDEGAGTRRRARSSGSAARSCSVWTRSRGRLPAARPPPPKAPAVRRARGSPRAPPPQVARIGTRGSALALAQASAVSAALGREARAVDVITTTGDRERAALDKERWVRELDDALLRGRVDLAVHSAKDVPAHLPDGRGHRRHTAARARGRRALRRGLARRAGRRGRASAPRRCWPRRAAARAARRPRDRRPARQRGHAARAACDAGDYDAIVLALAGLAAAVARGRGDRHAAGARPLLPGQGRPGGDHRAGEERARARGRSGDRPPAGAGVRRAERELVRALHADCHTPMGAYAHVSATPAR